MNLKLKKAFYLFIHLFFSSGLLYAFYHFITTPKSEMLHRRLWAYENWMILALYGLFVYLSLAEKEIRFTSKLNIKKHLQQFRIILGLNLLLLVFPWGLGLLLSPKYILAGLGYQSIYWRILGAGSLLGALIYYFPYRFYHHKLSYYIFIFGAFDNLIAGLIITYLYITKQVPLTAFSATPLLLYFSFFFYRQAKVYPKTIS